ncbi:hypothetical protein M5K25_024385 [Dendrobium thyrsiflorum]|uniref:Uncharacterized protein n=1 Tax=Dendrobium thyrsiflorum TaxID=117978 RepID=A0ABD0U1W1_DENTH
MKLPSTWSLRSDCCTQLRLRLGRLFYCFLKQKNSVLQSNKKVVLNEAFIVVFGESPRFHDSNRRPRV